MLNAINNSVATSEVTQPEQKVSNNIAYRGGSDYERTPYADSFESEEKKSSAGKTVGIIASVLAAAALVVGGICLHKGGKALEGAEEAEKTFGKKLKKGWEELWHKGEGAAEKKVETEAGKKVETEAGKKVETEAEKKVETEAGKKVETEAGKKVETEAGKDAEKTVESNSTDASPEKPTGA